MPGGFSNGFSSGFGSTPIREPWRLWAILYDSSFVQVATIPHILSGWTREAVNQVGSFEIVIPANDIDDALLTHGRIVGLFYEPEGEILRGRIEHTTTSDQDDRPTITVSCATLAIELVWQDTYFGITAVDDHAGTILNRILDDAETVWTSKLQSLGDGFVNVTNLFAPASSWQTALALAEMQGAFIRETATTRELELSQATINTDIALINPGTAPARESEGLGFISGLPSVQKDGSAVINRVVPLGLDSSDLRFDLGLSNRSSPYTIQNLVLAAPVVIETKYLNNVDQANSAGTSGPEMRGSIRAAGINRAVLIFAAIFTDNTAAGFASVNIGGIFAETIFETQDANDEYLLGAFIATGVPEGDLAITIVPSDPAPGRTDVVVVSLKNVKQFSPIRDFAVDLEANNNFSPLLTPTISVSGIASAVNDLLLDGLVVQRNTGDPDATPAAGQTSLGAELEWGATPGQAFGLTIGSSKPGAAGDQTMSWTLSPSDDFLFAAHAGVSVMPQPVYYIEDATSISAFGRRTARLVMNANRFAGATATELQNAANTLYDRAVTRLLRGKDGVTSYDLDILTLPRVPWLVGDSMRLVYNGVSNDGVYLSVDDDLIVLERQRIFDAAGTLKWHLRLANVYQHPASIAELLYGSEARLGELETAI